MSKINFIYFYMIILVGICIFSPIEASAVEQSKIMNLVYDSKNSTGKDFILPDIGVSVKTAFFILCKSGKMSLKHTYKVYADQQYYYFVDTFFGTPKKDDDIREKSVKISRDKKLTISDIKVE